LIAKRASLVASPESATSLRSAIRRAPPMPQVLLCSSLLRNSGGRIGPALQCGHWTHRQGRRIDNSSGFDRNPT
jgi:hypothetical protein